MGRISNDECLSAASYDLPSALSLSDREWELWCQQWHMYKRDYAIGITHGIMPRKDARYEVVCLYLEALTRIEIQEQPPGKKDGKAWVTFNPAKCTFCSQWYKTYENMVNAADAAWNHAVGCAEANFQIKGDGPLFQDSKLICLDAMSVIEARMTKHGGLDFETNFEWLFTNLVETAVGSRLDFFNSWLEEHKLALKKPNEELFGVNIPLLRLIANGQIFNSAFFHPMDELKEANAENPQCQELLDRWIKENIKTKPWGNLTIVEDNRSFPARSFSFSPSEKLGKLKNYSHPRLHPTRNQKRVGEVRLFIPTTGCLPMGSFCGTHGCGLIHPNLINASVMQLSYASTHSNAPVHWRTQCEPDPERAPDHVRAPFDMMSIAPNFDLQLEACTAEETAKTIVTFDLGPPIALDRDPIRTPGSTSNKKGSPEDIRKEVDIMLSAHRFGRWMGSTDAGEHNDPDHRCRVRLDLACHGRKDEMHWQNSCQG